MLARHACVQSCSFQRNENVYLEKSIQAHNYEQKAHVDKFVVFRMF